MPTSNQAGQPRTLRTKPSAGSTAGWMIGSLVATFIFWIIVASIINHLHERKMAASFPPPNKCDLGELAQVIKFTPEKEQANPTVTVKFHPWRDAETTLYIHQTAIPDSTLALMAEQGKTICLSQLKENPELALISLPY